MVFDLRVSLLLLTVVFGLIGRPTAAQEDPRPNLNVLFLGDNGHHQPRLRFVMLEPVMAKRGIALTYTDKLTDLNDDNLAKFDAVLLYANIDAIDPAAETALLKYVNSGGGFVPLHCASYCFRNSKALVAMMGAQFQRHGTGVFRTTLANSDHPIMQGFGGFESWDETYVHHLHNEQDRTVLSWRIDSEGKEPWTWIRTARRRPRFLYGLGSRCPDLEESRFSQPGRTRNSLGRPG